LLSATALAVIPAATAKDFGPGDLRVCNAHHCVPIVNRAVLPLLGRFYYLDAYTPRVAPQPRLGAPAFELRFRNGYVTGVAAGVRFDRFLSFGVNLDQFQQETWYRVPTRVVPRLRELTAGLTPLRLTAAALIDTRILPVQSTRATQPPLGRRRPVTPGRLGSSLPWVLGIVALAPLIALPLLARRGRRSVAAQPPTLGAR
jgi:hypothetical protein